MESEFEATVKRIMERTGISREELMLRIWRKCTQLSIVTLEGAAQMVGMELGVK